MVIPAFLLLQSPSGILMAETSSCPHSPMGWVSAVYPFSSPAPHLLPQRGGQWTLPALPFPKLHLASRASSTNLYQSIKLLPCNPKENTFCFFMAVLKQSMSHDFSDPQNYQWYYYWYLYFFFFCNLHHQGFRQELGVVVNQRETIWETDLMLYAHHPPENDLVSVSVWLLKGV